ncbi:MAG: beta-propeller fold lactonase family protein [Myxococcales bacterium]|nr:beta-propeller fold lactonase family protein [Myxococcales bacterium]
MKRAIWTVLLTLACEDDLARTGSARDSRSGPVPHDDQTYGDTSSPEDVAPGPDTAAFPDGGSAIPDTSAIPDGGTGPDVQADVTKLDSTLHDGSSHGSDAHLSDAHSGKPDGTTVMDTHVSEPDAEWASSGELDGGPSAAADDASEEGDSQDAAPEPVMPDVDWGWHTPGEEPDWEVGFNAFLWYEKQPMPSLRSGEPAPDWTSGRGICVRDGEIVVADAERERITILDEGTATLNRAVPVGGRPEQVVCLPDGAILATVRSTGRVVRVESGASEVSTSLDILFEPFGIAATSDGLRAAVTDAASGRLTVIDAMTLTAQGSIFVGDLPRGVAVAGDVAWVALQRGRVVSVVLGAPLAVSSSVELRNTNPHDAMSLPSLAARSVPSRAIAVAVDPGPGGAGDDSRILVGHTIVRPGLETDLLAPTNVPNQPKCKSLGYGGQSCDGGIPMGWNAAPIRPVEPTISVIDTGLTPTTPAAQTHVFGAHPELVNHVLDQPVDIGLHPKRHLLFLVAQGTDRVGIFDSDIGDPMSKPRLVVRVGEGPRAIAFSADGSRAYVLNAVGGTVSTIDLSKLFATDDHTQWPTAHASVAPLGADPLPEELRLGRRVFHYSRTPGLSFHGQFACATCHFDGTDDGLVWVVGDGPRQTPMLAGRLAGTGPFNWSGTAPTLEENIAATVTRMGGTTLTLETRESLAAYLVSGLIPPRNPNAAAPSALALEGQVLFEDPAIGCANCHVPPTYASAVTLDVGAASTIETYLATVDGASPPAFNTPSLRGLFATAPYLHTGAAASLYDVFEDTAGAMGHVGALTPAQLNALVTFMLTL